MLRTILSRVFGRQPALLAVGSQAPDFVLPAHDGTRVSSKELRGKRVLLWFYPKADTPG